MAKNSDYWRQRLIEQEEMTQAIDDRYLKQVEAELKAYQVEVLRDIEAFYGRYADRTGMTQAEAIKYLTNDELDQFQGVTLAKFRQMALDKEADQDLVEALSLRHRISRKEALLAEIQLKTAELYQERIKPQVHKNLSEVYAKSRLNVDDIYGVLNRAGYGTRRPTVDIQTVRNALRSNWSGKNLSQKIWGHEDWLYERMADALEEGLTGRDTLERVKTRIADLISDPGDSDRQTALYNAERLIRTESAAYNTMATLDEFDQKWIRSGYLEATLDHRTSAHCRRIHNKRIPDLRKAKVGIDLPPFHPWCRTIVVPEDIDEYFGDLDDPTRDITLEEAFQAVEDRLDEIIAGM